MNWAEIALNRRTTTFVLSAFLTVGGLVMFESLGRLEDPEYTIKEALVITQYPGATPLEVEEEVTEKVEEAIQSMRQLKRLKYSISRAGVSIINAEMQDKYDKETLPQVWDELRRKVNDVQPQLPPGAGPSIVNDDFGDVFGVFFALTGEDYSYAELKDFARTLKREFLLLPDVSKVSYWGMQDEAVYVEMSRARMSELGMSPSRLMQTIGSQNEVSNAGYFKVGPDYMRFNPTGLFDSVQDIGELILRGAEGTSLVRVKDVATIRRDYVDPPTQIMSFNGRPAIGVAVSTALGGNVLVMGDAIKRHLDEMRDRTPVGMELHVVSFQADDVTTAINGFLINLVEAVIIVVLVLVAFMGMRSALLIGLILLVTIVSSFPFMSTWDVMLQRISLGALIIALGMLVDNAIVIVDGILIGMQRGIDKTKAAIDTVGQTSMPLLGATAVAILAFTAIGLSPDSTGEYCRALFQVILISLGLSWVFAVTLTPVLGVMFLKPPVQKEGQSSDPYGGKFYLGYKAFLQGCIRARWLTIGVIVGSLAAAIFGFGFIKEAFFPDSTRKQFYLDFWMPEGAHIAETHKRVVEISNWIRTLDGVTDTATFAGGGATRFLLTYTPEDPNSAFGHIIVGVEDYTKIDQLGKQVEQYIYENYPEAQAFYKKFVVGPGSAAKIEAQFRGPDLEVLRGLSERAKAMLREQGAIRVRDDWRQRVKVIQPVYAESPARLSGIARPDLNRALEFTFDGTRIGLYREKEELLPIIGRAPQEERLDVNNVYSAMTWGGVFPAAVPVNQIVSRIDTVVQDSIIKRQNRQRAIRAQADPPPGETAESFRQKLDPLMRQIELPPGYEFDWQGEYYDSNKANVALAQQLPGTLLMMILIVILLYDALRQTAVVWLTVPLAMIGVTVGLLVTNQPFGFMAILGLLSLIGMLIKNAIVLIDQIDTNIRQGMDPMEGVVMGGVSRVRPVSMAALTTMLGMIPLFGDAFFVAMAVAIVFGLGFATILTLIVVPVLYATIFSIPSPRGC